MDVEICFSGVTVISRIYAWHIECIAFCENKNWNVSLYENVETFVLVHGSNISLYAYMIDIILNDL